MEENINKINAICDYYDDIKESFDSVAKKIKEELQELLYINSIAYGLSHSNSVYNDIYFYEVSSRVKTKKSLYEKIIRKNLVSKLKDGEDIQRFLYEELNDIIGIKIITNLHTDCGSVYKLLETELNKNTNFKVDFKSISMPDKMDNGREIYKFDVNYTSGDTNYVFELQIKSKIDSAWGDLEHVLFYKDYDFYYAKDDNKEIMVNVGNLLCDLEAIMYKIRNAKNDMKANSKLYKFRENMIKPLMPKIKDYLKVPFLVDKYIEFLLSLYETRNGIKYLDERIDPEKTRIYEYEEITIDTTDNLYKQYTNFRKNNFHMFILENIYYNWLVKNNEYTYNLEDLIILVKHKLKDGINAYVEKNKIEHLEKEDIVDLIINTFSKEKELNFDIILDNNKLNNLVEMFIFVNEYLYEDEQIYILTPLFEQSGIQKGEIIQRIYEKLIIIYCILDNKKCDGVLGERIFEKTIKSFNQFLEKRHKDSNTYNIINNFLIYEMEGVE